MFWHKHYCDCEIEGQTTEELQSLCEQFLASPAASLLYNRDIRYRDPMVSFDAGSLPPPSRAESLVYASQLGRTEVIESLLHTGTNVNEAWNDTNALIAAVTYSHKSIVQLFLDRGADVKAINEGALKAAISKQDVITAKLLIENLGTEVSQRSSVFGNSD